MAYRGGTVKNGERFGRPSCFLSWSMNIYRAAFKEVLGATKVLLFGRLKTSSKFIIVLWSSEKNVWTSCNEVAISFLLEDMTLLFWVGMSMHTV